MLFKIASKHFFRFNSAQHFLQIRVNLFLEALLPVSPWFLTADLGLYQCDRLEYIY